MIKKNMRFLEKYLHVRKVNSIADIPMNTALQAHERHKRVSGLNVLLTYASSTCTYTH